MPVDSRNSVTIVVDKLALESGNDTNGEVQRKEHANFETAIAATGYGKFQYLLLLTIIPVTWATSIDTSNISIILPSAECDLQITLFQKGLLNAITFVGMVSSGFLWGYIADVRGRRTVFLYGYLADGICNVLSGFSQNFSTLVFFKFLSGFIISGPHAATVTYCSEFYGIKGRVRIPLILGFSITFGNIVTAALAWLVVPQSWSIVLGDGIFVYNSWRIFLSLCGAPMLLGVVCLSLFPESPKFLMSQGRNEEALNVFQTIYRVNTGKPATEYPIQSLEERSVRKLSKANEKDKKASIFSYPHCLRLCLITTMQFATMLTCGFDPCLHALYVSTFDSLSELTKQEEIVELYDPCKDTAPMVLLRQNLYFMCDRLANISLSPPNNTAYIALRMNTIRLWQPELFTILDNFDSLSYNGTTERDPSFCEILDHSTAQKATEVEQLSCTDIVVRDSVYLNTILISTAGSLFLLSASFISQVLNHKSLLFIAYGVALSCIVYMIWSTNTMITLALTCVFTGMMNTAVNVVVGVVVVLFPTSLRTMAVSLVMCFGRTGSIIGNMVFPVLLEYGCLAPILTLSIFVLICILLGCLLPRSRRPE